MRTVPFLCLFVLFLTSCKVHEYVDLGLPSGTLWATCNLGADTPEEFGEFFAWGEKAPKASYDRENYSFLTNRMTLSWRNDAARRRWGGRWRMPTADDWGELMEQCSWRWLPAWDGQDAVKGYRVIGPNGNSLFLPAAGDIDGMTHFGINTYGDYWSSSNYDEKPHEAQGLIFYSDGGIRIYSWDRASGHTIRPVR